MRVALASVLALLLLPAASAVAPPVVPEGTEIVSSHGRFSFATMHSCSSSDPVVGALSTTLTSRLMHVAAGSRTRYTMHLDAVPGDASCPAVDLSFLSSAAWPSAMGQFHHGDLVTDCGATGSVSVMRFESGTSFQSTWNSVPAACGWTIGPQTMLSLWIQPVQPSPTQVCSPLAFSGCTGAAEYSQPVPGCTYESLNVNVAGITLLYGAHGCEFWTDGHEYAAFGDGVGMVTIVATEDSCTLRIGDTLGEPVQQQAPCPAELGDLIYGMDWHEPVP